MLDCPAATCCPWATRGPADANRQAAIAANVTGQTARRQRILVEGMKGPHLAVGQSGLNTYIGRHEHSDPTEHAGSAVYRHKTCGSARPGVLPGPSEAQRSPPDHRYGWWIFR
jgi:hypothetical protein